MEHEKRQLSGWTVGVLVVLLLLICGAGSLGIVGFFTYSRLRAVEELRAVEAEQRAMEARLRAVEAERATEAAKGQEVADEKAIQP